MNKVDVFIPCAPKDYTKMKYAILSLIKHIKEIGDIHICTPSPIQPLDIDYNIKYHLDFDVLPNINPFKWRHRPNWIYQQMIKLFQNVTATDYYFTYDIDGILIKDLSLFTKNNKPIWYSAWEQNHQPYFNFSKKIFGYDKIYPLTFISDTCFFNKIFVKEMLEKFGYTQKSFLDKSYEIIDNSCYISESELYGNYMMGYNPAIYEVKPLNQKLIEKFQYSALDSTFNENEINEILKYYENNENAFDMIQLRSLCVDTKNYWHR